MAVGSRLSERKPLYKLAAEEKSIDLGIEYTRFLHGLPDEWTNDFLWQHKERNNGAVMPKGIINTRERHGDDPTTWPDDWYDPGYALNDHLQWSVKSWNTYISATAEARKKPGDLYGSKEDFERRSSITLWAASPKSFVNRCDEDDYY
ncbi:hypothetical protein CCHL11_03871 [Colletotrichum chlorophyti]|uniref:Uncharacterized protein n=1 Tax=Colletotrichum chlorophyti TaxID=708187 RepID=A0A1Q8RQR6_9PEZI|nr:hypothetical protein CCHL11_03871 [Colletotrichum chlorophyti]